MGRIENTFSKLKETNKTAFMPFITAGYPDLNTTKEIILAMEKGGADLIELGLPFSDSIADGPTIQKASDEAIAAGTTVSGIMQMIRDLRKESEIPILLMGSYNMAVVYGVENFCRDSSEAGADGFILPDVLPDDADELITHSRKYNLDTVFLIAPNSSDERIKLIAEKSSGFVYAVSLTGVTGEREELPAELAAFIKKAATLINLPICVGFGISTPAMAGMVSEYADGVIIGSAIVKRITSAISNKSNPASEVYDFISEISKSL
ncbi:MAG: tryptophan synthase subunit alpha [Planctomycetota bacterium]|jgi:tryptophan synthase alpha chain